MQIAEKQLTPIQQDTLMAIHEFRAENGYMPTYAELAKKRSTAVQPTQYQIDRLIDAGYLEVHSGDARGLAFAKSIEWEGKKIPVLGVCN